MFYYKNTRGISLIEVVVSIAIITIAFFSIINSFPFSLNNSRMAQNMTSASYLAQAGMEEVLSIVYEDLTVGEFETRARLSEDEESFLYKFERETNISYVDENIEEAVEDSGLKKIEVTVYWQSPIGDGEKTHELKTLVSDK